jgi:two-component system sensor histidine kinase KdpD
MQTNDDKRPDPDALLEALRHESAKQQRGKLKIFFGMSAGVGKTYAMLEAAHQRLIEGVDVVIGYIETHKRAETDALVEGLPIIPRKKIDYRGTMLEEMDVDAILERKPQLALVDELAHTNAPGSRHPKRYQDVLDLITAGIDVYTTVNVQHLESRTDAVQQITGITIHETVPDMLIDIADKIELIDLEPEELLKRLSEGKVYSPDRAQLAAGNFFRQGNLTALREMALRLTAERVDQQMQDYMQVKQIQGPWKSVERLMVAVSPSPLSERLIRWTRRMAYNLKAEWLAVYVDPLRPLDETQRAQLAHNLSLVHKLGGEVISTSGEDPVREIIHVAQQRNVTQIVVGKPAQAGFWDWLNGGSLVNRLVTVSGDIDVYVVRGDKEEADTKARRIRAPELHSNASQYVIAAVAILVGLGICRLFVPIVGYHEVALILLFIIVLLANFVGRGPVIFAAGLSAIMLDLLFIPPFYTLTISSVQDGILLVMYFIIAVVTGNLTARLGSQKRLINLREHRTSALYTMAHEIAESLTMDEVLHTAVEQIGEVFDAEIAILLPTPLGNLSKDPHPASTLAVDEKEYGVASWAFDHKQIAGRFTETLPVANAQYWPLVTPGGVAGVIGVRMRNTEQITVDQEGMLQTFVNHIALAVERELLDKATRRTEVAEESERLYATLMASVSQELQTPLKAIDGATDAILKPDNLGNTSIQVKAGTEIADANTILKGIVNNLLDMTRVESGHLKLNLEPTNVQTLIETSLKRVEKEMAPHDLIVDIPDDLPPCPIDFNLMEQALTNLLHNAAIHTPAQVRIRVTVRVEGPDMVISVADRGQGLPAENMEHVFDKFYRAPGTTAHGVGLGLSITKGLVEAHGGTISAENRPTRGGARFTIRLPLVTPENVQAHTHTAIPA